MTDTQRLPATDLPWLDAPRASIAAALRSGKFPHALLIQGHAGVGKRALAEWIAQLALCDESGANPCGRCPSCLLYAAGNHPDLRHVGLEEEAKQVKIDAIRELAEALSLRSYRGGRKVGIIDPADLMNMSSANALLKTLEEPSENTLLILVAARVDRLPATIGSRCQRLKVRVPDAATAKAWVVQRATAADAMACLRLAGGAPLLALEMAEAGLADLDREMTAFLPTLAKSDADVVTAAERWAKQRPSDRLRWLELWASAEIRTALGVEAAVRHIPLKSALPVGSPTRHIHGLFGLLDRTRAAQGLLRGSVNPQLLLESTLLAVADVLKPQSQ